MINNPPKIVSLREIVGGGYNDFFRCKKRYRVVKGSRGSKKSKDTAIDVIKKIVEYDKCNWLCIRRYQNTLRDSMYSDLMWAIEKLGLTAFFEGTISPLQIVYKPTGQKILFRGLDEGTKVTSISVTYGVLNFVWIEEAYEITNEDDFNKLDMSIRGEVPDGYFKQITFTFNPWSANSWLKARFFDQPDDDVFTLTTTYECNEWLDEADRRIFEKMKKNNPKRYRIEGMGEWGIAEGLIFENHRMDAFDIDELKKIPQIKSAFGLDFGFTDPNAFICVLVDSVNMKIYVIDEWYKTGCTNKQIAQAVKDKGYGGQVIYCDSAEPKSIKELQDEGLRTKPARKGRDSVNHGIQLIQNYEIIVHPRCIEFWKEIENYCWATDKNGKATDKPEHDFSHGMDALRYAVGKVILPETFSFD